MIKQIDIKRYVNWIAQLAASFCLHADVFAQMSPSQLFRYVDEKGLERSNVLTGSEWNGMMMHSYSISLNKSLDNTVRYLSDLFNQPQAIQLKHDELPLLMLHWQHQNTSMFIVISQVSAGRTVGLLSTLELSTGHSTTVRSEENQHRFKSAVLPESLLSETKKYGHQQLFMFQDQHILAGFVGVGTIQSASRMFQRVLKWHAWLPISERHDCQDGIAQKDTRPSHDGPSRSCKHIMTKNGLSMEISHIDAGNRALTLFFAKTPG